MGVSCKRFINACKIAEIAKIDEMIQRGFPAYLYMYDIFDVIYEYERSDLLEYIVQYMKKHPLNVRGEFYREHLFWILAYRLYELIVGNKIDELHKFLSDWMHNACFMLNVTLVYKLMKNKSITDETIEVLKVYKMCNSHPIKEIERLNCIDRDSIIVWYLHSYDMTFYSFDTSEHIWNKVSQFEDDIKERFLDAILNCKIDKSIFETDEILSDILRAKKVDLFTEIVAKYKLKLTFENYMDSCAIGDYQLSRDLLFKIYGDDDERLTKDIRKWSMDLEHVYHTILKTGNKKLIRLHREMLEVICTENQIKAIENQRDDMNDIIDGFNNYIDFREMTKQLEKFVSYAKESNDEFIHVHDNISFKIFASIYHICLDEPLIMEDAVMKLHHLEVIINKYNGSIKNELYEHLSFCNGVKNIVYGYASYTIQERRKLVSL